MAEISNRSLSLLVLATFVVVVASVVVHFSTRDQYYGGLTGFATTDTGYVNLTINSTLAIQVDPTNETINFGQCTGYGTSYWCATNDSAICDANGFANCTGDTATAQFIRLDNVGNIDANITNMTSECTAATLIGGSSPAFNFIATQCNGTGVSSWTAFTTTGMNVCTNLSYLGGMLRVYANVTIPANAVGASGGCSGNSSDITFTAVATT